MTSSMTQNDVTCFGAINFDKGNNAKKLTRAQIFRNFTTTKKFKIGKIDESIVLIGWTITISMNQWNHEEDTIYIIVHKNSAMEISKISKIKFWKYSNIVVFAKVSCIFWCFKCVLLRFLTLCIEYILMNRWFCCCVSSMFSAMCSKYVLFQSIP